MTSLRHHRRGFWSVAFAFMAVMAFSTVPSPLYGLYQQADGFSSFTVTVVYGAYAIGVVGALFLAGHLSDSRGRRRVLLLAIAASAVSALGFLLWHDLAGLLVARIVNGASVGVVTATATVYLAELYAAGRPGADPGRPQLVATAVNLGGLGLGPLVAGALAEWAPDPLRLPFLVFLGLLGAALLVVALAPETRPAAVPPRPTAPSASRSRPVSGASSSPPRPARSWPSARSGCSTAWPARSSPTRSRSTRICWPGSPCSSSSGVASPPRSPRARGRRGGCWPPGSRSCSRAWCSASPGRGCPRRASGSSSPAAPSAAPAPAR